jgi:DNA-binding Xre family transcriptional regulator
LQQPIVGNIGDIAIAKRRKFVISYQKLWATMEKKGATTYTLQVKGGISSSTIRRLKANESVSTNTLDALCKILDCTVSDIIEYVEE